MPNTQNVEDALDNAREAGNLASAVVVAKDTKGKVAFFTAEMDREAMIVLLERARNALVRSLED